MNLNPYEIRKELKEIIQDTPDPKTRDVLREAHDLIRQMSGDLRRQGFTEYNEKEENL